MDKRGENKKFLKIGSLAVLILGGVAIIVGLIGFFVFIYEQRKLMSIMKTHFREVKEASAKIRTGHIETVEANKIAQKLKIQLGLLERAYKKGYIKKSSYEKGKSRLKEVYHKLKKKYL